MYVLTHWYKHVNSSLGIVASSHQGSPVPNTRGGLTVREWIGATAYKLAIATK
jgi:hypothetical protein